MKLVSFMPSGFRIFCLEILFQCLAGDRFHQAAGPIQAGAILPARARLEDQRRHHGGAVGRRRSGQLGRT